LEDVAVVRGAMGDAVDVEAQRGSPIGEVEMEASPAEQLQPQQQQLQQQHDSPRKGDKSFGSRGVRITFKASAAAWLACRRGLSEASVQYECGGGDRGCGRGLHC